MGKKRVVVTKELLESVKTHNGGYCKNQMFALGLGWPPKPGWQRRVLGRTVRWSKIQPKYVRFKKKKKRKKKKRKDRILQTQWEWKFAAMLEVRGIPYKSNKKIRCASKRVYFPDFLIAGKYVVEIDGRQYHNSPDQRRKDNLRTVELKQSGIREVLRLWNSDVTIGESHPEVRAVLKKCEQWNRGDLADALLVDC